MRRWVVLLLVASLTACSTPTKVVRLDTGQGKPSVHVPRRHVEPVEVSQEEFKQAVAKHAPSVPVVERPLEYVGRLFGVPERSGCSGTRAGASGSWPRSRVATTACVCCPRTRS